MKTDRHQLGKISREIFSSISVERWIVSFFSTLGIEKVDTDPDALEKIQKHIFDESARITTIFQLTGHFVAAFCYYRPINTVFPSLAPWHKLRSIENHQNSIIAIELCRHAFDEIYFIIGDDDSNSCLKAPKLEFSKYFYIDLVEALSTSDLKSSPRMIALIFESLIYSQLNPATSPNAEHAESEESDLNLHRKTLE